MKTDLRFWLAVVIGLALITIVIVAPDGAGWFMLGGAWGIITLKELLDEKPWGTVAYDAAWTIAAFAFAFAQPF